MIPAAQSSAWNEIEARIATFVAAIAGDNAVTTISIFFAVKNDAAKKATINVISRLRMDKTLQNQFEEILAETNQRYSERNVVVHGHWGISQKYPGKLLWCDTRDSTILHAEMMELARPGLAAKRKKRLIQAQKQLMVYSTKDFLDIIDRMQSSYKRLCDFTRPIMQAQLGPYAKVDEPEL